MTRAIWRAGVVAIMVLSTAPCFGQELEAQAVVSQQEPTAIPAARGLPVVRSRAVTVHLIGHSFSLGGSLLETPTLAFKTSFGQTQIPVAEVAGVKLAQEGVPSTTVVLQNGDTLTGAIEMDRLILETTWGKAAIYSTNIDSILFAPGLKWVNKTGLNGTRWTLEASEPPTTQAVSTNPTAANSDGTTADTAQANTTVPAANPAAVRQAQPQAINYNYNTRPYYYNNRFGR